MTRVPTASTLPKLPTSLPKPPKNNQRPHWFLVKFDTYLFETPDMHTMSYEVLYNSCYGQFDLPDEFVRDVFQQYPPESEEGKQLWKPTLDSFIRSSDSIPSGRYVHRIVKTEEFCHGYHRIYYEVLDKNGHPEKYQSFLDTPSNYCTNDFKTFYYLRYTPDWRTSAVVLSMARKHALIGSDEFGTSLRTAKVPTHYVYRIHQCDGMEIVHAVCPTERIIADLLAKIHNTPHEVHPLTQRLLDGATIRDILNPSVKYDSDSD